MSTHPVLPRFLFTLAACWIALAGLPGTAQAQYSEDADLSDLRRTLDVMGKGYARGYVQPLTDAFGADMNSGFFRTANTDDGLLPFLPFDLYIGVNVSGVPTSELDDTFVPPAQETLSDGTVITFNGDRAPTVFGSTETPDDATLTVRDPDDGTEDTYAVPPGLIDAPVAPLVMPQVRIGSIWGTDAQVRYFPKSTLSAGGGSYGTVGLFGAAVRHSLDQWVPALPFHLAVQGAYTQFTLENDVEVNSRVESQEVVSAAGWAVNLHASRDLPVVPLTLYGGVQYERFEMDYSYTFDPPGTAAPVGIALNQTGANTTRALAGASLTLAFIRINADYALGDATNVLTTAIGLRL